MPRVQKIPSPFAKRRFMPSSAKAGPVPAGRSVAGLKPFAGSRAPKRIILYAYCAFVFSLPFEMAEVEVAGGLLTLSKFLGYLFVILTLLQPSLCFKKPPKAVWYFAAYLVIFAIAGFFLVQAQPGDQELQKLLLSRFFSRVQMLVLFWISYNLMREEIVVKGTLLSLSVSVVALTLLQICRLGWGNSKGSWHCVRRKSKQRCRRLFNRASCPIWTGLRPSVYRLENPINFLGDVGFNCSLHCADWFARCDSSFGTEFWHSHL